jgi:ribonuclease-3
MKNFPYEQIERLIGYTFQDKALLLTAFTHSSYAKTYGGEDNERLEYLGDAVLSLLIAKWQYDGKRSSEGEMTKERMQVKSWLKNI